MQTTKNKYSSLYCHIIDIDKSEAEDTSEGRASQSNSAKFADPVLDAKRRTQASILETKRRLHEKIEEHLTKVDLATTEDDLQQISQSFLPSLQSELSNISHSDQFENSWLMNGHTHV